MLGQERPHKQHSYPASDRSTPAILSLYQGLVLYNAYRVVGWDNLALKVCQSRQYIVNVSRLYSSCQEEQDASEDQRVHYYTYKYTLITLVQITFQIK